ncbi:MAG: SMC-Scp complex subunit ScpB [Ignavibacteria bacterium]
MSISTEIKNIVESMIFASEEEVTARQMKDIVDKSGLRVTVNEIEESVNALNEEYKHHSKPFEILKLAGGYAFATKKEYGRFIGRLFEDKQRKKLSASALETLSIIAYKQPIIRSEIEFIRGVNVDYIVNSLLEKELITITGRAETPGRPILYGTTKTFLKVLGLNSLEDLPKLKEINDILKNEEIEGITEADIELFNSVNSPEIYKENAAGHQLELLSAENINEETEEIMGDKSTDATIVEDFIKENSAEQTEEIIENSLSDGTITEELIKENSGDETEAISKTELNEEDSINTDESESENK